MCLCFRIAGSNFSASLGMMPQMKFLMALVESVIIIELLFLNSAYLIARMMTVVSASLAL